MKYPLEDYRVVCFGTAWAAPMLSQLLADMGAEVIKIESRKKMDGIRLGRPIIGDDIAGGDEGRWPDMQPAFHGLNRNKMSFTVDLKNAKGIKIVKRLIKIADVVVDNFSPAVPKKLGLDHESLELIKPDIITVSLTGAGEYGPLRDTITYAHSITALGGLNSLIGYRNEPILGTMAVAYGDANASIHGLLAVMAALIYRDQTAEGQHIEISESEAVTYVIGEAIMEYCMNGRVLGPQGNHHHVMSPHNNYRCKGEDQWVSIAIYSDKEWEAFCRVVKLSWTNDKRWSDKYYRLENREELDKHLTEWTVNYTPYEAMDLLQKEGVAAVPVMNVADQFSDPHFRERQTFCEIEHPLIGYEFLYGIPLRLSRTVCAIRRPAPSLGEHNDYVLGELLGFSSEEILSLEKEKVIY